MSGGGKKKALKLSWQEMQAQFGDKSRNPLDNLPTSSRSHDDQGRDSFRSNIYDRDRRERREDRDEGPSRADESSAWRSATASGPSSFRNNDRLSGRSDDRLSGRSDESGAWRTSRLQSTSSFSSYGRRDDIPRETDMSARPRLNLMRPSADRLAAAQEQQMAAKTTTSEETRSNPFGDAKPASVRPSTAAAAASKPIPFGDAKPLGKTAAEPWRPRSIRASESETPSSRFARPAETPAVVAEPASSRFARPSDTPAAIRPREVDAPAVKLVPSLPPRKAAAPAPVVKERRAPSPAKAVASEPVPPCPVRSALEVSMDEGTWVTADELADCIALVSLESDEAIDAMGNVIALSLANKTVLLPSTVTLIPKAQLPAVLQRALTQLMKTMSAEQIEDVVGDVNVVEALGVDPSLNREEVVARLTDMGLQQLAPKGNVAALFKSLCDQDASNEQLVAELKARFPRKSKVPVDVASVISEYVVRKALDSGAFKQDALEQYRDASAVVTTTIDTQTHFLFGVQEAWFARGTAIKRSGKAIFEALYEMRLISVDAMVAWMHDKARSIGKRQLLLQCGGYISDLQNSAIAHQYENSDSEASVDLDGDFPQANRNYDDY